MGRQLLLRTFQVCCIDAPRSSRTQCSKSLACGLLYTPKGETEALSVTASCFQRCFCQCKKARSIWQRIFFYFEETHTYTHLTHTHAHTHVHTQTRACTHVRTPTHLVHKEEVTVCSVRRISKSGNCQILEQCFSTQRCLGRVRVLPGGAESILAHSCKRELTVGQGGWRSRYSDRAGRKTVSSRSLLI